MNCPRCKDDKNMIAVVKMEIEIDYCSTCRGVWLDRGELDKIINLYQEENLAEKVAPLDYVAEAIYEDAYNKVKNDFKYKRSKSLLKELFG